MRSEVAAPRNRPAKSIPASTSRESPDFARSARRAITPRNGPGCYPLLMPGTSVLTIRQRITAATDRPRDHAERHNRHHQGFRRHRTAGSDSVCFLARRDIYRPAEHRFRERVCGDHFGRRKCVERNTGNQGYRARCVLRRLRVRFSHGNGGSIQERRPSIATDFL